MVKTYAYFKLEDKTYSNLDQTVQIYFRPPEGKTDYISKSTNTI